MLWKLIREIGCCIHQELSDLVRTRLQSHGCWGRNSAGTGHLREIVVQRVGTKCQCFKPTKERVEVDAFQIGDFCSDEDVFLVIILTPVRSFGRILGITNRRIIFFGPTDLTVADGEAIGEIVAVWPIQQMVYGYGISTSVSRGFLYLLGTRSWKDGIKTLRLYNWGGSLHLMHSFPSSWQRVQGVSWSHRVLSLTQDRHEDRFRPLLWPSGTGASPRSLHRN